MTKKKIDWRVQCVGLLCITGIEIYAISKGMNGYMLATIIGILAFAIGVKITTPEFLKR